MMTALTTDDDLAEALALIEAVMATISRRGENMLFDERKRLVSSLYEAGNLIETIQKVRQSDRLTAAITAIEQVRQFLVQRQRH